VTNQEDRLGVVSKWYGRFQFLLGKIPFGLVILAGIIESFVVWRVHASAASADQAVAWLLMGIAWVIYYLFIRNTSTENIGDDSDSDIDDIYEDGKPTRHYWVRLNKDPAQQPSLKNMFVGSCFISVISAAFILVPLQGMINGPSFIKDPTPYLAATVCWGGAAVLLVFWTYFIVRTFALKLKYWRKATTRRD
jgi:hypothetical protein